MQKFKYKILKLLSSSLTKVMLFTKKEQEKMLKKQFKHVGDNFRIMDGYYITGEQHIEIGDNFDAGYKLRMEAIIKYEKQVFNPTLKIGDNVNINFNVHIACCNQVEIKDNVLMASNIFITDHLHGETTRESLKKIPKKRDLKYGTVKIGNNVLIGQNVTILPNVEIGDNCIIGANSVVTKKFPPNSVIAGIPAKILKTIS